MTDTTTEAKVFRPRDSVSKHINTMWATTYPCNPGSACDPAKPIELASKPYSNMPNNPPCFNPHIQLQTASGNNACAINSSCCFESTRCCWHDTPQKTHTETASYSSLQDKLRRKRRLTRAFPSCMLDLSACSTMRVLQQTPVAASALDIHHAAWCMNRRTLWAPCLVPGTAPAQQRLQHYHTPEQQQHHIWKGNAVTVSSS